MKQILVESNEAHLEASWDNPHLRKIFAQVAANGLVRLFYKVLTEQDDDQEFYQLLDKNQNLACIQNYNKKLKEWEEEEVNLVQQPEYGTDAPYLVDIIEICFAINLLKLMAK